MDEERRAFEASGRRPKVIRVTACHPNLLMPVRLGVPWPIKLLLSLMYTVGASVVGQIFAHGSGAWHALVAVVGEARAKEIMRGRLNGA